MNIIVKTAEEILPLSDESLARLELLKNIKDEDIDTSDMPELTNEQLTRMKPVHFVNSKYAFSSH